MSVRAKGALTRDPQATATLGAHALVNSRDVWKWASAQAPPWQTRSSQKNNLTSVKRQVINFMMQNPNTGKWRENNSAVSNSARPHPSTQPPKKPLFMHLKDFLLSWLLLFPKLHNHRQRPLRWGRQALCWMIYDRSKVGESLMDKCGSGMFVVWIRSRFFALNSGPAGAKM